MNTVVGFGFIHFLAYAFMFMCGSLLGWVLELFYRRFFSDEKKWINPGFLTGPCVPLYGFGLCAMYAMANIPVSDLAPVWAIHAIRIAVMSVSMTLIEYIAGLIFIKGMKVKLWDYSKNRGNIQGIICPLFSFFWTVLSAAYYFIAAPFVNDSILWFVNNIWFSYFVGIFTGVFAIDFAISLNLMTKLRSFAKEREIVIRTEELKKSIVAFKEEHKLKGRFVYVMHNLESLKDRLEDYAEKMERRK